MPLNPTAKELLDLMPPEDKVMLRIQVLDVSGEVVDEATTELFPKALYVGMLQRIMPFVGRTLDKWLHFKKIQRN